MKNFVPIKNYENYLIDKTGKVFSQKSSKFMTWHADTNGYMSVYLCVNGLKKRFSQHRLVAQTFIPNPENKPQVNHKDGDKKNNCVENLEWVTPSENSQHSIRVLGNPKPPTFKGKFGKDHNRSLSFKCIINGKERVFCSQLEFTRETGLNNTSISWALHNKKLPYTFTRRGMKGIVLVENLGMLYSK